MDNEQNKKTIVKIVCLLLSFGLWLYVNNIENPIKEYKIDNVPVHIVNEDILKDLNLVIMPEQSLKTSITVEGPIKDVYNVKSSDIRVNADLKGYALKAGDNKIPIEITNYPQGVNIKNNDFLRVSIVLDKYVEKKFDVKEMLTLEVEKGFYKGDTQINPKTVMVSGPEQYVSEVAEVRAEGSYTGLKEKLDKSINLRAYDSQGHQVKYVDISPQVANVSVAISKGKKVEVKVATTGAIKDGLKLKSIDVKDSLEIFGNEDIINKISSIETEPIDLSNINSTKTITLKLIIPEGVSIADNISTVDVTVQVEKYITRNFNVKIEASNTPSDLDITFKDMAIIEVEGEDSIISSIKESDLTATMDLSNIVEGENTIDYIVKGLPSYAHIKSKEPQKVIVTAKKKSN